MIFAKILLAVSALVMFGLMWRLSRQRLARHVWKGFRSDPMPQDSWQLFDRAEYTPAGQRLLPWFIAVYAVTLLLAFFLVVSSI